MNISELVAHTVKETICEAHLMELQRPENISISPFSEAFVFAVLPPLHKLTFLLYNLIKCL